MAAIVIASAINAQMQRVVGICDSEGVEFRTVPMLKQLGPALVRFDDLKPVAIDDLLGREPVSLDWESIRAGLTGKRVLVTGGGDRKSTRLNSSHVANSYAVFCLKKKHTQSR